VEMQHRSTGLIRIRLAEPSSASPRELRYKQNPKVVKFDHTGERTIALENASESFHVGVVEVETYGGRKLSAVVQYVLLSKSLVDADGNSWPRPTDDWS